MQPLLVLNQPKIGGESNGSALIGAPVYWPLASVPKGYLPMIGQAFDKAAYPELAKVYPSGVLPDSRNDYFRIAGDGVAPLTRQAQSVQPLGFRGNALPGHAHDTHLPRGNYKNNEAGSGGPSNGAASPWRSSAVSAGTPTGTITGTGAETRPRSLLWNCITRAE